MFQDRGKVDVGQSIFFGAMSGTVFVCTQARTVEKASADTEMEEIPSTVPSRYSEVCLVVIVIYSFPLLYAYLLMSVVHYSLKNAWNTMFQEKDQLMVVSLS